MRWEALFADLEAELEAAEAAALSGEVADRIRRETSRLRLADRLRAATGHRLVVAVAGGTAVTGRLDAVGPDWLLLAEATGRAALIPAAAVLSVTGLGRTTAEPGSEGTVGARLDLRYALRGLARGRAEAAVTLTDGTVVHGTLDRVGMDFVEVAEHPAGEPRRAAAIQAVRALPLPALAIVRSG